MKSYYGELFDVCANRHGGNSESAKAYEKAESMIPHKRAAALRYIASQGERGATAQEYADFLGVGINAVSGRFSELKKAGLIRKVGTRGNGGVFAANDQGEAQPPAKKL